MINGETVLSGAPHPGTELKILSTNAGYYLGFLDADGFPYSRESEYMSPAEVVALLRKLRT